MAKLFLLLLLVASVLDSSFGAVCGNPARYARKSLCDPWGGYCGECVSFYKVCYRNFWFRFIVIRFSLIEILLSRFVQGTNE